MPTQPDQAKQPVSNDLEDFIIPSIGPDQARARFKSCEYISFDYNGQMKDDPVIAVKAMLEPQDGENDGKDFEIEWTTGAKMKEFAIVEDGGKLLPTQSKSALTTGSNWASCLKSMKDCGFDTRLLNGPAGIRYFSQDNGAIMVLKRIKQPERSGIEAKDSKGRDKMYYTVLKIESLPGEKGARKTKATAPASTTATATASAPSAAPSSANGLDVASIIKAALASNGGSITIQELQKAIFMGAKAAGSPVNVSAQVAKASVEESALARMAE